MMGQCKYAFQMLRYAFGIKGNSVAAVILVIAGLVLEFISHGTNFLGSFFVVVLSMFPVQFLYSISLSNHVASSPYRKRLQTSMPALMNLTLNIGIFTLLNIIKAVEIYLFPEDTELIIGSLIMLSVAELIITIYTGIVFKYYIIATVVMVAFYSFLGGIFLWGKRLLRERSSSAMCCSLWELCSSIWYLLFFTVNLCPSGPRALP